MPLEKGRSEKAFSHNMRTEMDAGKPQKQSLAIAYAMKRRGKKMAEGGFIKDEEAEYDPTQDPMPMRNDMAMEEDDRDLNQHGEWEEGPQGAYANGGMTEANPKQDSDMLDMVGRIMAQRQKCYSKGGQVANDTPITADFKENDFDDLAMRDSDMEDADYTGANSGDEMGDEGEDDRRRDIVNRIMSSRKKRDRMPHPA